MPHRALLFLAVYLGTAAAVEKTVITFNAALYEAIGLGVVPNPPSREARRDAIIAALNNPANDADCVCLQEVYMGEDVDKIIDDVSATYPYTFSQLHDSSGNLPLDGLDTRPACGNGFVQVILFRVFMTCAENNCNNIQSTQDAIDCISSNCLVQYVALPQECTTCIIVTGPEFAEVRQRCSRPLSYRPMRYRNMNVPGLLLLSKTSMSNTSHVDYHPESREFTGHYSYLQAQVTGIGQVACTHATPYAAGLYPEIQITLNEGIFSYVQQGAAELSKLVTAFGTTSPVLLLGDFNVGDAVASGIRAVQPANYEIMTSAFQTQSEDECTFCDAPENAYNGVSPRIVIDHVFYNGVTYKNGTIQRHTVKIPQISLSKIRPEKNPFLTKLSL